MTAGQAVSAEAESKFLNAYAQLAVLVAPVTAATLRATSRAPGPGGLTYTITGGSKPEEVRTPCPPTVRLRGQSEMAGVLLRTISPEVRLSISPTFALVGARADDFAAVRVSRAGTTLLEAPLTGRGFRWPTGTAPLVANTDYELVLVPKAEGKAQVTLKFRAERGTPTAAGDHLTLISVD